MQTPGTDLEQRLRRLEALSEIRDLKARYLRACDLQQPETVRDTLLPDAVIAYEGFPSFSDRDAFVDVYRQMGCQPHVFDIHHGANPEIVFDADDRARGKWALFFQNINVDTRTVTQMGLEYDDVYVRRDGRWWIAETRTRRTSFLSQVIDEDGTPRVAAMGEAPGAFGEA